MQDWLLILEGRGQVRVGEGLTDLEKPTQHTALSNTPRPSTCKVERETESQMRTWGGNGCRKERVCCLGSQLPASPTPEPHPSLPILLPPLCYLPLLSGACHLASGNGDHIRVDSQTKEREDRWTGSVGDRGPRITPQQASHNA